MSAVAGRRTYTEDELQAALRDIQSGKLGTRRAAVIYGIPRSTLRNKVYKLALERERESHLNNTSSSNLKIDDEEPDDDKELSGAEEEKEVEKALQQPLLSLEDIARFSNLESLEAVKQLVRKQEWLGVGVEHPWVQNLLVSGGAKPTESELTALIPELVQRMVAEEQLFKVAAAATGGQNGDSNTEKGDSEPEEAAPNVILKIPSFRPTTGTGTGSSSSKTNGFQSPPQDSCSPPIPKSLTIKEVIAKSISQKFQQSPDPVPVPVVRIPVELEYKRSGFTPPLGLGVIKNQSVFHHQQNVQHQQQQQQQQKSQNASGTTQAPQGGKGTRPKRGKYRNYDRDSLVEAVRAVQRGEMSVHRAGSYYGVPHSTLEYKVKERHLMRPRKRDPKPNPVDEKIASLKQNDLLRSGEKLKPKPLQQQQQQQHQQQQQQKFGGPNSPNGLKMPMFDPTMAPMGYSPAPFPFWPHPGFHQFPPMEYGARSSAAAAAAAAAATAFPTNPDFFAASQMMQKMQEERTTPSSGSSSAGSTGTLPKTTRQIAESLLEAPGANGSFLDGIIRSSLESGVPVGEDKLMTTKEERNVAPENMSNKALLDQLCRNSRLTPLPKPSGDEALKSPKSPEDTSPSTSPSQCQPQTKTQSHQSQFQTQSRSRSPPVVALVATRDEIQTIDLSNDSTTETEEIVKAPPGRIYLKQELTKPENLKPEMLVRFRNGVEAPEAVQD